MCPVSTGPRCVYVCVYKSRTVCGGRVEERKSTKLFSRRSSLHTTEDLDLQMSLLWSKLVFLPQIYYVTIQSCQL